MLRDLLPLLPLQYIKIGDHWERLFFLIKIVRLQIGFELFSAYRIMSVYKKFEKKRLDDIINNDPEKAEDIVNDLNGISGIISTNFAIKIIRVCLVVFNLSYFLGFFWFIFC